MQVLVIEDEPLTLKVLGFLLKNEGYTVHPVGSVTHGMEVLREQPIDLIVMDVNLPDGNGVDLCKQLRGKNVNLPILVISARSDRNDKITALVSGADDYMTKPFDPAEVAARVYALARRTLETHAPELQTRLCVGHVCLDVRSQSLIDTKSGREVALTKMEAQLLHVLMRNAGQVLPHDRLITEAWGTDYEGSSNQLEVYVHRLRTKLRQVAGERELIRTVPGGSYEMVAAEQNSA